MPRPMIDKDKLLAALRDPCDPATAPVLPVLRPADLLELRAEAPRTAGARIGEQLLAAGVVTRTGLAEGVALKSRLPGKPLGWILVMLDHVRREQLDRLLAARAGVPSVSIAAYQPVPGHRQRLPASTARQHGMALLHEDERTAWVAFADATDRRALEVAGFVLGKRVVPVQASRTEIGVFLSRRELDADSVWRNPTAGYVPVGGFDGAAGVRGL